MVFGEAPIYLVPALAMIRTKSRKHPGNEYGPIFHVPYSANHLPMKLMMVKARPFRNIAECDAASTVHPSTSLHFAAIAMQLWL
jgi:hypothetical protein